MNATIVQPPPADLSIPGAYRIIGIGGIGRVDTNSNDSPHVSIDDAAVTETTENTRQQEGLEQIARA